MNREDFGFSFINSGVCLNPHPGGCFLIEKEKEKTKKKKTKKKKQGGLQNFHDFESFLQVVK